MHLLLAANTRMECRRTPFPMQTRRVKKSPFKTTMKAKAALSKAKRSKPIGFTARSSLKSMGLIPRADGCYTLGSKYA